MAQLIKNPPAMWETWVDVYISSELKNNFLIMKNFKVEGKIYEALILSNP